MKPAKLGFLLGFFIFCLLMAPGQNGVARLTRTICHKYKDICNMDMEPGSCYEVHFRFFYNKTSKECQSFLFTGCDGNLNNFRLKIECDIECNEKYRTFQDSLQSHRETLSQKKKKEINQQQQKKATKIVDDSAIKKSNVQ
ncbi:Spint4 [Phodopus roborovskii]|uniref:Spint4 protein n=1 Tax=Phodopus roborovskii TaxID=109678 RepID=A0AAU9YPR8_PHORO|nr:Spint4 [Phodopus roborovskii]